MAMWTIQQRTSSALPERIEGDEVSKRETLPPVRDDLGVLTGSLRCGQQMDADARDLWTGVGRPTSLSYRSRQSFSGKPFDPSELIHFNPASGCLTRQ